MNLYQKYKYNKIFTKKQIFGFCFLLLMNYFLFQLLNYLEEVTGNFI